MRQGTRVEVLQFDPSLLPTFCTGKLSVAHSRDFRWVLILLGTVCLHAIVIYVAASGTGMKKLPAPGAFATQGSSVVEPAEELILIAVADAPRDKSDLARQIASLAPKLKPAPISIISPDRLLVTNLGDPNDTSEDPPARDELDPATRALMLNRYLGQISARVQGAWVQPAEPVTNMAAGAGLKERFKCRVQIRQDADGNVQEVLLLKCAEGEAWQRSLVTAIYQASPLNAPPIPGVFNRALTMTFEAPDPDRGTSNEVSPTR